MNLILSDEILNFLICTLLLTMILISTSSITSVSGEIDVSNEKINQFIDNDQYSELLDYANEILVSQTDNEDALVAKGMALYYLDKEEESLEFFNKALEINPKNEDALDFKASALYYLEQYILSKVYFDKSVLLVPGNTYALDYLDDLSNILPHPENYIDSSQFDHLTSYYDFSFRPTLITIPEQFTSNWYVDDSNNFAMKFKENIKDGENWNIEHSYEDGDNQIMFTNSNIEELFLLLSFFEGDEREHDYEQNKTLLLSTLDKTMLLFLESRQGYNFERISSTLEEYNNGFVYSIITAAAVENDLSIGQIYLRIISMDNGRTLTVILPLSFFTDYGKSNTLEMLNSIYLGDVQNIPSSQNEKTSSTFDSDLFSITSPADWTREIYNSNYIVNGITTPVAFVGWDNDYVGNSPPSMSVMYKEENKLDEYDFDPYSDIELIDQQMEENFLDSVDIGVYDLKFINEKLERFNDHIQFTFENRYSLGELELQSKNIIWKFKDGKIFSLQYSANKIDYQTFLENFESTIESFEIKSHVSKTQASTTQEVKKSIPGWIKSNAEFWANDQIDDDTFVSGIQFLIKNGIIDIPVTDKISQEQSNEIPSWIKSNASFWVQGLISDDDFLSGIEYLVKQGIIKV